MPLSSLVVKAQALSKNSILERAFKTFVEATAAQAALYTTVVPNTPGVKGAATVSAGATVLSVAWNLLITWATTAKSKRLDQFAKAIDDIVDMRVDASTTEVSTLAKMHTSGLITDSELVAHVDAAAPTDGNAP